MRIGFQTAALGNCLEIQNKGWKQVIKNGRTVNIPFYSNRCNKLS